MFGLLGKNLSHSFSKDIHEYFSKKEYTLFETDNLEEFFSTISFKGINVTIPYKEKVIPYIHDLSEVAKETNVVNTIVRRGSKLFGYNTDFFGLSEALKNRNISVKNHTIIILGNGATSKTIQYYCKQNFAKKIIVLARNPKANEHDFSEYKTYSDASIVFNATPIGMFPNNNDTVPIDINLLPKLVSVIDVVYNPLRSNLLIQAENKGIKTVNGLSMLINQAMMAIKIFHNIDISRTQIKSYTYQLLMKQMNIVLIGMPMSGKTHYSKILAQKYNKEFIDLDQEIEIRLNMKIPNIFHSLGESFFRQEEQNLINRLYKSHNYAISTGGGIILNNKNIDLLKQNGIIIFLDMPLDMLQKCNPKNRPLLKIRKNLDDLYNKRYDLYVKSADLRIIKDDYNEDVIIKRIEENLDEYINHKWS